MSEQIKKSDVSEKDVFGWIIESAKIAEEQIEAMNQQLSVSAKLSKEALKGKGTSDVSSLKAVEQAVASTNNLLKQKLKLEADLISIQAKKTNAETQLTKAIERSNREEAKKIQQQEKLTSAYSRVDGWLRNLTKEYRELAIRQELSGKLSEAEIKRMTTLEGRIKTYDGALKQVDATMGKHQRNVGNYAGAWNGLGNSVNQLTREMPAFANSVQTGFMAISNNLPIFFDEIGKIKKANKELITQGQPVKSVFRQLGSAIFSLGTILSVGVTLLTVYGKELVTWISNVAKGSYSVRSFAENQKTLNEAIKEGTKNGIREATQLDILYRTATNLNLSLEQRKKAVDKLQEQYPSYFDNLEDEDILVGKAVTQYERLRDAIFDSARAKAIQSKLEERGIERFDTELKILEKIKKAESERNKLIKSGKDLIIKGSREERTQDIIITNKELIEAQTRALKIYYGQLNNFKKNAIKEDELLLKAQYEYYKKAEDLESDRIKIKDKGTGSTKKRTKAIEKETKVIEYHVKALQDLHKMERVRWADIEAIDDALFKRAKTEQEVYLLMAELTENEKLIREARITKIKADLKIELDSKKHTKAEEELLTLQAQKQIQDIERDSFKKRMNEYKEYTDLITDYAIKQSNRRIEQIERESQNAQKNYDLLVDLAKNGNIQAQQSLAQEQKNIIEANKKKEQELQKQELIKLGGTAIDTFASKVANNDKTPLLSTIKDITLLRAFISSLASFDVGSERTFADSGSGIDGKGGRMAIVHPNEKIFTEEHSKKIGFDISNNEVADIISLYKQGTLVPINKVGAFAGTSYDLKPLLIEVQELKDVIKNQPIPNLEVGRITRDLYEFGQRTVKGNTTTIDKYQIRKR
jgi:hypothetical protein